MQQPTMTMESEIMTTAFVRGRDEVDGEGGVGGHLKDGCLRLCVEPT